MVVSTATATFEKLFSTLEPRVYVLISTSTAHTFEWLANREHHAILNRLGPRYHDAAFSPPHFFRLRPTHPRTKFRPRAMPGTVVKSVNPELELRESGPSNEKAWETVCEFLEGGCPTTSTLSYSLMFVTSGKEKWPCFLRPCTFRPSYKDMGFRKSNCQP